MNMKTMELRMYKYRIYPSRKQKDRLLNQFKICKEIYNTLLAENKKLWTTNKFDFNNLVKDIKITCPEYYSQAHSQVLQNVSDRLHKAFNSFFKRIKENAKEKGYPRFKSRIKSIIYPQSGFKFLNQRRLYASKIGSIPIVLHRVPKGKIKTLAIKVNKANQWFAVFSCEIENMGKNHSFPTNSKIGIDVGIENFATLSNGEVIDNPRYLIKSERKLKLLGRRLSRKKKGSNNRNKARFRLAKQHIKVVNQRTDFQHKLSRSLSFQYSIIAVEDLNIKSLIPDNYLAKHINDASWSRFIQMLSYKAVISGGQLIKVNPRNTSKTCSNCGTIIEMPLSKRTFKCPKCGIVLHRDLNASINIQDRAGLARISTPVGDTVRPSSLKARVVEAGTIHGK